MDTAHTAASTTDSIISALSGHDISKAEQQKINDIISASLVNAIETSTAHHVKTTVRCCGPEADLAHKISHEINLKKRALIANLLAPS